ncbi:hypothetical protein [uncultured Winogradskyella sp.]|uniref:hypothetical protein n=1 Tax=uncultured Winogradskyella sp. TaxID=395353 RepID=UPI00263435FE|nr:hypothetical protein [uncultured Winogradskyella sp.]
MAEGTLIKDQLITKDALGWGLEYEKNLNIAIAKNEELKKSAIELFDIYKQLQGVSNNKQLGTLQQKQITITQTATKAYEDQGKALAKVDEERQKSLTSLLRTTNKLQNVNTQTNKQNIEARETLRLQNLEIKRNLTFMGRLTNERDKARKSVQELQAKLALGKKLSDQEQKELRESTREFNKYDKAVKGIRKSTNQFQENVGNYPKFLQPAIASLKTFIPLIGAGLGLREAFNFANEARQLALQAKGIEFAFDRVNNSSEILNRTLKATRGLVSELDVKRAVVQLDNFNLNVEQTDTLLELAAVRAAQTGDSFEDMLNQVVLGLGRESTARLDDLGITQKRINEEVDKGKEFMQAFVDVAKEEIPRAGAVLDEAANSQQKFNAAYEDFQLSVGKGLISKAGDAFNRLGTFILKAITPTKSLTEEVIQQQTELQTLRFRIFNVNTTNEERVRLINQLKSVYPDLLKNIDAEKVSNEELQIAIKSVNDELVNKILIAQADDKIAEQAIKTAKVKEGLLLNQVELENAVAEGLKKAEGFKLDSTKTDIENARALTEYLDSKETFNNQYAEQIKLINFGINNIEVQQKRLNKQEEEGINLLSAKDELLKRLGIETKKQSNDTGEITEAQARNVKFIQELINKEQEKLKLATNRDEAKAIQDRIVLLQKELQAILGNNKALKSKQDFSQQDAFNLSKQQLQSQIDAQKRILDSDDETTSKRLASVVNYTDKSILLLQLERKRAIELAKGRTDEIKRIELAYSDDYDALIREREDNVQVILQSSFEKTKARIEAENQLQVNATNQRINEAQARLRADLETLNGPARLARIQAYEDEVTKIEREAAEERLRNQITVIEKELANPMLDPEQRIALERMLTDAKIALSDEATENAIANAELQAQAEQRLFDMKQQLIVQASQNIADSLGLNARNIENFFNAFLLKAEETGDAVIDKYNQVSQTLSQIGSIGAVTGDILQSVFEANILGIDEQIDAQEDYYERQIQLAGEDESQREALEQEREIKRQQLEEKKRQEQIKAARFAKAFSIFNIAITTAQAAIGALAPPPIGLGPVLGIPLAATAIGFGALQIGAVLAKPIPKYRYGTEDHPGGPAEVAEVRPEVILEPGKKPYIQKTRATLNLAPHTQVIPSVEEFSNQMIAASIMTSLAYEKRNLNDYETLLAFEKYSGEMVDELKNNTKAVKALKLRVNVHNQKYDIPYQLFRSQNIKWP